MEPHCCYCDLEVDVNGEETFILNKTILSTYSSKLSNLFKNVKPALKAKRVKLIFNDFPGGARSFELVSRFCYNNGEVKITPFNISFLYSAAFYMKMDKSNVGTQNLLDQTENFIEDINSWTWSELIAALKQCQDTFINDSIWSMLLQKCVESLVERLVLATESSSCASTSSPDSSGYRFSCDSKSTESVKNTLTRVTWWYDDLLFMRHHLLDMVVRSMISHKLDHTLISKFLFSHQKSKLAAATMTADEKREVIKSVIYMISLLDSSFVSMKYMFEIRRISISLNVENSWITMIDGMIGLRMDTVMIDNLLVPSPIGSNYLYDVDLVLSLLKFYLGGYSPPCSAGVRKVANLIDVYSTEVAPDQCLEPLKYIALVTALPDSARVSHDVIYHAIDMYLQVHPNISEEEKLKLCSVVKSAKLSHEALHHLTLNTRFSSQIVTVPKSNKSNLEKLVSSSHMEVTEAQDHQVVVYDEEIDIEKENERLRSHVQGMQCRVDELEKACKKMQNQMMKIMKSRSSTSRNVRSLPKLCS